MASRDDALELERQRQNESLLNLLGRGARQVQQDPLFQAGPGGPIAAILKQLTGGAVSRGIDTAVDAVDDFAARNLGRTLIRDRDPALSFEGDMVGPSPESKSDVVPNLSEIIKQAERTGDVISLRGDVASLSKDKTKSAVTAAEGSSERATRGFTDPLINLQRDLQEQERLKEQTNTANALSTVLDTFEAQSSDETLKARIAQIRNTLARDPAQAPILLREILPLALKGLTLATG